MLDPPSVRVIEIVSKQYSLKPATWVGNPVDVTAKY